MFRHVTLLRNSVKYTFLGHHKGTPLLRYAQTLVSAKTGPDYELDLNDYKTVFASRRLLDIVRALFVFKICSYDFVVANSLKLMHVGKKILGTRLYERLMKMTIYGQFVGGATTEQITSRVRSLNEIGVGALLFIPIEEVLGEQSDPDKLYHRNLQTVKDCIKLAKSLDKAHPMAQLKLTALVPVELCKELSKLIPDPQPEHIDKIANAMKSGCLPLQDILSTEDSFTLSKSLARIKQVCEFAESQGVYIWVDAEYTYLNPALRLISLAMMLTTNKRKPVIAYTYQNYLKETFVNLKRDVEYISSRNVCFGAKLVRGAYLVKERQMALEHGYPDPVHDTFNDTSDMYHSSMLFLMDKVREKPDRFFMIVASHNENTVQLALQGMFAKQIPADKGAIYFGQVYGMSDYLSFALGKAGYLVYKSIPFGTIDETIPYLHRRAMENKSVLGETRRERKILKSACFDKLSLGLLPARKQTLT